MKFCHLNPLIVFSKKYFAYPNSLRYIQWKQFVFLAHNQKSDFFQSYACQTCDTTSVNIDDLIIFTVIRHVLLYLESS